ncbi:MAG: rhomboid family intramembrane serine protease [Alphaproteobacteria bacterium]|nr:rhomboid family intramembrane serine protease [Alphaproteobacteria bacterium]|tara:strand:+ start:326 stop:1033 length:708 start_codon:yes stop_codon:yes gene_type:complete
MPLIPLHDANPRLYIRAHYVTIALVLLNAVIFVSALGLSEAQAYDAILRYAVIPARLFGEVDLPAGLAAVSAPVTLLSHQFLHGGWEHLIFNMLFLWVFGDNIEDALGHLRFVVFFVVCGAAGGLAQSLVDPGSTTPVIGASGSISGVLGAYLLLYPRARLLVLLFAFIPLRLPALLVIGTFFAQDVLWAATSSPAALSVAVWAHISGFLTGALLIVFMRNKQVVLWHRPSDPWG